MKKYSIHLTVILFITILSGCMVGPKYQKPVVQTPAHFTYADTTGQDSAFDLEWWMLFEDPQLEKLIRTALSANKDVRIAAARIEEARASVGYKRADMWPMIGYEANIQGGNLNTVLNSGKTTNHNTYYAAPFLSWEIDFWGKYRSATEAAKADLLATEYGYRSVMISLITGVTSTYYQLLDYDNQLAISRQTLESRKESTWIVRERFNKGIVPEIDVNQAEIQENIAAAYIPQYERAVAQTEHALSILLGQMPGNIDRGIELNKQPIPPDIPPGLPSDLLTRRPDICYSEQALVAQNAYIGVAQAVRFPSFSLTGLFGAASPELTFSAASAAWSVGGDILGPIFNFNKNKRRVEVERQRYQQALLDYDQTVLQAFREVEDGLIGISTFRTELEAVNRQRVAAQNAAVLSRSRYDGGVTSYLEVLDSERTLFDTELNASQTLRELLTSYVILYKALGGGWISREEKAAASTPPQTE
ncbi:MAG: efflux transporter outer membrane subunit [Bacteroidales bacterium]|nr:efflux transporter outer membrane subunit [Lentimicrobiaceae bacterium]MDD5695935.1 efflux transporter outer membrane subunit [Bacteroidales bacterium]